MSKPNYLGEFEQLILLALMQNGGKTWGSQIRATLAEKIARDTSIGALYATLERLEKKGFVQSELGEPTAQRGGRAKRYFEVTAKGKSVLSQSKANLHIMWQGVQLCRTC